MELLFILVVVLGIAILTIHSFCKDRLSNLANLKQKIVDRGGIISKEASWIDAIYQYDQTVNRLKNKIFDLNVEITIAEHLDTLLRKREQMVYVDDYGVLIRDKWDRELIYFNERVLFPALGIYGKNKQFLEVWAQTTDDIVMDLASKECREKSYIRYDVEMTGIEYEYFVAGLMREYGWDVKVLPATGDHGADLIAEKKNVRAAIQCKFYSSPVGNKSVQEVYFAKDFYDCNLAAVITNSSFTVSAKNAAHKLDVTLMHHNQLSSL